MRIALQESTDTLDAFLAASDDGTPLGSVGVKWQGFGRPEEAAALPGVPEISGLYVRPSSRGRGIGSALLRVAEERIAARGIPLAALAVNVENVRARALYEREGYVDVRVRSTGPKGTDALLARVLHLDGDDGGRGVAAGAAVLDVVTWADGRVRGLRAAQQDELRRRYTLLHVEGATGDAVNGDPLEADAGVGARAVTTLLARIGDEPVGTVAVCELSAAAAGSVRDTLGDVRAAEVKRLYVSPAARRRGLSRALMASAEGHARRAGVGALVLETGRLQPEAIALYTGLGFTPIETYPPYAGDPTSLCLARRLSSSVPATAC
ncbi:GCN5-related protein N-acetyltransferase [Beutenbergia cavernae DSM 12333]|uniref:GCN5-related protein N-acetyltransferase n=1 Tax=Beutenbergia cavernae (strain ATCC BAA-8 / DSM 12333 / CCUG 43141 / JCM 11478 / NBRC 16432 / NCIMB 13614 / HKI 0122) TaxID=471853 RepID=C5C2Y8_BEUC1|nr:GNAT family N-acetyltransferase [Beutenbergia cavernae]ACQ81832.1 GCN5-related protein N-acetyltransferase [Beutenbergia cavernae DSM 12333]